MTEQDRQLLLKELCSRVPCHPNIKIFDKCTSIEWDDTLTFANFTEYMDVRFEIKPYLRPVSSMTDYECNKLFEILEINEDSPKEWLKINDIEIIRLFTQEGKDFYEIAYAMDFLHSIHVDFRELIEKGLAIKAPEEMYEIK